MFWTTSLIKLKIFISSDHAGFSLKNYIFENLKKKNHKIINLGPFSDKSVDYPIFAKKLANKVSKNKSSFGFIRNSIRRFFFVYYMFLLIDLK